MASGCPSAYHEAFRLGGKAHVAKAEYDLYFVEADDEGWFWDPAQADQAFEGIVQSVATRDTIVVTFVHGWHHSARCCDGNLEGFKEVLRQLHAELAKPMYDRARAAIHGGAGAGPFRVIGVYVGWRGRSLPGLIDYVTFWGRKSAAERVGESDFQEFMIRLKDAYEQHSAAAGPKLFGLITIGHSFGGQVVLRAVAPFLEHRLADLSPVARGYLRNVPRAQLGEPLPQPLRGFGDLVVLINPATEAAAYQRVHALGRQLRYSVDQTPVMLTLSADNDVPRDRLFKVGRVAGEWFTAKPRKEDPRERGMERQALGFFAEQVTHRLEPAQAARRLRATTLQSDKDGGCTAVGQCEFEWYEWRDSAEPSVEPDTLSTDAFTEEAVARIAAHDLSSRTVLSDVVLRPEASAIARQALIVATVADNVIDGHNGMFSGPLMRFLTKYIGFVEAKRFLSRLRTGRGQ
jgi:pimeloyl-ACP methyl ester carboxylesterase